ncbi:MAG TPA: molybdenum cofactor guanylyltransferase [Acetobacteraceae bacterium]|nr:molybdenum cofactor guanylyltransferase [Acetobacteraceae bacterium]
MTAPIPGLFGLVLAGGAARRLGGGDKPLLDVGGQTMLERALAVLRAECAAVAISANGDKARFARFGVPVLDDGPFVGRGPLAGVLAGLDWAAGQGGTVLLTLPGDTPFAPLGLARRLGAPPACAANGGRSHFLVAVWPVAAREALRRRLAGTGSVAAGAFAAAIGMRPVDFPAEPDDPFLNVNTAEDLARARLGVRRR